MVKLLSDAGRHTAADIKAGGAAWAGQFIARIKMNPQGYNLQGWIEDAETRLFKGNKQELEAFYATLQDALLTTERGGVPRPPELPSDIAHIAMEGFAHLDATLSGIHALIQEGNYESAEMLCGAGLYITRDWSNLADCHRANAVIWQKKNLAAMAGVEHE